MVNLYCVRDRVAEESGPIFAAKNHAVAKRQYDAMLGKEGVQPLDYSLLFLGSYDPEKTIIFPVSVAEEVILTVNSEVE